jgi:hypothetical protein
MLQATEGILKSTLQYRATAIPAAWQINYYFCKSFVCCFFDLSLINTANFSVYN